MSKPKPGWREAFLEAFARTCNIAVSCRMAGVRRSTYYKAVRKDREFAALVDDARKDAVEALEYQAWKRAAEGSDRLLIFLLKAHCPEKYASLQRVEMSGREGRPGQVGSAVVTMTAEKLKALASDEEGARALKVLALREAKMIAEQQEKD
jgi:hypothetical protein